MKSQHSDILIGAIVLLGVLSIIWTVMVVTDYLMAFPLAPSGHEDAVRQTWGTIGDYFGGVLNPLFAGAGFFALLATIILQAEELSATREEMKKTSEALSEQVDLMKTEAKKVDLHRMIRDIEERLDKALKDEVITEQKVEMPVWTILDRKHRNSNFYEMKANATVSLPSLVPAITRGFGVV